MANKKEKMSAEIGPQTDISNNLYTENHTMSSDDLSTNSNQDKRKGRHFWYVVYPDSAPADWKDELIKTGLSFCVSPLHDKDLNPDGIPKKPHYHVIISWGNTTTYKSARNLCSVLNCPYPQLLHSATGAYRYHQHKDNPDKYQYIESSTTYNNWEIPLDNLEVKKIKSDLFEFIILNGISEYSVLLTECKFKSEEWFDVASNNTFYFSSLIKSFRHEPLLCLHAYYKNLSENDDETKKLIQKQIDRYSNYGLNKNDDEN